ncbi:hypothetical protein ACHQM5_000504 [Ranunculus cassubicifolius]
MDMNQWKEMFPCLISKAATVEVISNGETSNRNGAIQLVCPFYIALALYSLYVHSISHWFNLWIIVY